MLLVDFEGIFGVSGVIEKMVVNSIEILALELGNAQILCEEVFADIFGNRIDAD